MEKRKRLINEIRWFLGTILGGITAFLFIYRLLDIEINLEIIVLGAISALLAVYIVRLTVWVFNKNI